MFNSVFFLITCYHSYINSCRGKLFVHAYAEIYPSGTLQIPFNFAMQNFFCNQGEEVIDN